MFSDAACVTSTTTARNTEDYERFVLWKLQYFDHLLISAILHHPVTLHRLVTSHYSITSHFEIHHIVNPVIFFI